jgi:hypothetical protein
MVGGMVSSAVLTLIVIPAIYSLWQESRLRRSAEDELPGDVALMPDHAPLGAPS